MQPSNPLSAREKLLMALIALLGAFAIILQCILMVQTNKEAGIPAGFTLGNYFSFFTVLTNTLVTLSTGLPLISSNSKLSVFFTRTATKTAITVYIFIVSAVYNLVLRAVWHPVGLNILTDELLHVAIPLLFLIYWFLYSKTRELEWKDIIPWLLFPAIYLAYTLVRGSFTGWYPYPFLNVTELGLSQVMLNATFVLLAIIVTSLVLVTINKRKWLV